MLAKKFLFWLIFVVPFVLVYPFGKWFSGRLPEFPPDGPLVSSFLWQGQSVLVVLFACTSFLAAGLSFSGWVGRKLRNDAIRQDDAWEEGRLGLDAASVRVVKIPDAEVNEAMSNKAWVEHAYPLQQVTVKLQGTRHSDKADIVNQLETVLARLKAGDTSGYDHDDDFGYAFEYVKASPGPSFFDEPAGAT